jgi:hypothetical protein
MVDPKEYEENAEDTTGSSTDTAQLKKDYDINTKDTTGSESGNSVKENADDVTK